MEQHEIGRDISHGRFEKYSFAMAIISVANSGDDEFFCKEAAMANVPRFAGLSSLRDLYGAPPANPRSPDSS
jgi:hypothetical protein